MASSWKENQEEVKKIISFMSHHHHQHVDRGGRLIELDLLHGVGGNSQQATASHQPPGHKRGIDEELGVQFTPSTTEETRQRRRRRYRGVSETVRGLGENG
ncbi:hypothetical protein QYF36_017932 [Acer negundo]|nr:hypothetical protein QYF36_017932 [Acer negundo]